jgi:hypothetical protein
VARQKEKRKKEPFVARLRRRGREVLDLGRILVHQPRQFPQALLAVLRRSLRTIWDARGGGLYACGYVLTFAWLETKMFFDDIVSADSVGGYLGEQLFEMLFRYLGESISNMIAAFLWPVSVIDIRPPLGLIALAILFAVFPRWIKPALERWLFADEDATPVAGKPAD